MLFAEDSRRRVFELSVPCTIPISKDKYSLTVIEKENYWVVQVEPVSEKSQSGTITGATTRDNSSTNPSDLIPYDPFSW